MLRGTLFVMSMVVTAQYTGSLISEEVNGLSLTNNKYFSIINLFLNGQDDGDQSRVRPNTVQASVSPATIVNISTDYGVVISSDAQSFIMYSLGGFETNLLGNISLHYDISDRALVQLQMINSLDIEYLDYDTLTTHTIPFRNTETFIVNRDGDDCYLTAHSYNYDPTTGTYVFTKTLTYDGVTYPTPDMTVISYVRPMIQYGFEAGVWTRIMSLGKKVPCNITGDIVFIDKSFSVPMDVEEASLYIVEVSSVFRNSTCDSFVVDLQAQYELVLQNTQISNVYNATYNEDCYHKLMTMYSNRTQAKYAYQYAQSLSPFDVSQDIVSVQIFGVPEYNIAFDSSILNDGFIGSPVASCNYTWEVESL